MENQYTLNKLEFLVKEFFWYAVVTWIENELNPLNWTMWDNLFMIIMYIILQLYILGTCLKENKEEENGN
jgi:hypothetical protein